MNIRKNPSILSKDSKTSNAASAVSTQPAVISCSCVK